jgi:type 1 fimbriae regulatory protein FimB/type 1 fimbriae regulatory protein FimE
MRQTAHLRVVEPEANTGEIQTGPLRRKNSEYRDREYLTVAEVEKLMAAARKLGRNGVRDELMIRMGFRHGLRASELCGLTWGQIDFDAQRITVKRVKRGNESTQPLSREEMRALRALRKADPAGRYIFINERGSPVSVAGFQKTLARLAVSIKFPIKVHPHMLRHAAGFALSDRGLDIREIQHALGHRDIKHTVRYVEMAPSRLDKMWG